MIYWRLRIPARSTLWGKAFCNIPNPVSCQRFISNILHNPEIRNIWQSRVMHRYRNNLRASAQIHRGNEKPEVKYNDLGNIQKSEGQSKQQGYGKTGTGYTHSIAVSVCDHVLCIVRVLEVAKTTEEVLEFRGGFPLVVNCHRWLWQEIVSTTTIATS